MDIIKIIKLFIKLTIKLIKKLDTKYNNYIIVFAYLELILSCMKKAKKTLIKLILEKEIKEKAIKFIKRMTINEALKYSSTKVPKKYVKICKLLLEIMINKNE